VKLLGFVRDLGKFAVARRIRQVEKSLAAARRQGQEIAFALMCEAG